jgi:1,4-dihydroxy-2-naphthoate octaprenyltransferase
MNSIKIIFKYYPLVLLIFILNTAAQLLHEIVDYKEDKKINKITTTVRFGTKTSLVLFKLCLFLTMVISILISQNFILISISSIIFSFIFLLIKKVRKDTRKKFKILGIFFGIVYLLDLLEM